ncbi:hypothetical protein HMPREF9444_02157 [Succinatimonas hippei YIT 12066]|uniref:Uncharacterized protein n=1 Tax=Succinatimonas hippei (strain DSM 22608 / JCM 16073 / KCTC 15190 / YIT 12066) TaxID=762983 RepID=E8LN04_SUCHY|nr:hypothetical protein HMPREF9444_02157 [Succinatimonas hippei YIT 12066]
MIIFKKIVCAHQNPRFKGKTKINLSCMLDCILFFMIADRSDLYLSFLFLRQCKPDIL